MKRARSASWIVLLGLGFAGLARAAEPERLVSVGTSVDWSPGVRSAAEGAPARIVVRWDAVESEPGRPDWTALGETIDALSSTGSPVIVAVEPSHAAYLPQGGVPSPLDPRTLDAWLAFLRGTVRALGDRLQAIEIDGALGAGVTPEAYAFLLKTSALAIRAESPKPPRVIQAPLPLADLDRARALWERDVAAYVDVVAVRVGSDGEAEALRRFVAESIAHPPAAKVWAYVERSSASPWDAPAGALRALAAGAETALVDIAPDDPATSNVTRWIALVERTIAPGYASAPIGAVRFEGSSGEARTDAEALAAFVFSDGAASIVWVRAPLGGAGDDRVVLDTPFANNVRSLDPQSEAAEHVGSRPAASGRGRSVPIVRADAPSAVLYDRPTGTAGFDLGPQEIETKGTHELTAEEIVARYQEVQRGEDDRLERWIADARIDYHAKFAQGGATVDVSIDARYFWERGAALEWEETGYRVNGNRVHWEKFPEIPLIQPEKVFTLPLDLTLDRTYRYRRVGREPIDGRDAYVLEFTPADPAPGKSLYQGRVWIDAEGFWRVRVSLLQTGLEAPVLSNEEVDHYAAEQNPGGGTPFRLLERTNGQQNWSIGGRTVVVRREVTFARYDVNPAQAEFESQRKAAYASNHKMVRDTPEGIRYLSRNDDGTRSVKPVDSNQWFAAAGAFRDSSSGGVQPFAGANYFDYDLGGKDIQINALLGGVVNLLTASKPDIGHKISATVDGFASAIYFSDQVFLGQEDLDTETIDERPQRLGLRFGFPLRPYLRLNLGLGLGFRQYDTNDDSTAALAAYNAAHPGQSVRIVLPENHHTLGGELELEFNRKGWTVRGDASWDERSDWAAFGPFDGTAGTFVRFDPTTGSYVPSAPEPVEDRFALYGVTVFREWILPAFQKLRIEGDWLDGSKQDRFSSYQFSLFGEDRLNGFAGTGVRFDRGWIARGGWSFNLFEAIRFDAVIETAGVRERGSPQQTSSFTGAGLAATVLGPWKTVINLSYGRALASDIPELEGSDEFFFLVLKLF